MTDRLPYPPPYQNLATLAEHICASESAIENWVKTGQFPAPKIVGGLQRWSWKEVSAHQNGGKLPRKKKTSKFYVYVVGFGPYVKIGFTSFSVKIRVASLNSSCPEPVTIYAAIEGGTLALEAELHERFKEYRTHREWFRREGKLNEWIEAGCQL